MSGGALGIVTQPTAGLFRSARKTLARHGAVEARSVFCDAREHAAHAEAAKLDTQDRKELLAAWERVTGSYSIKQRMKEEKQRLASLDQHFRAGGSSSRSSNDGPERRSSWSSDVGRRGSLSSVMSRMKGKGKEKQQSDTSSNETATPARSVHSRTTSSNNPYQHEREQRIPGSYDSYVTDEKYPSGASSSHTSPRGESSGLPQPRRDSRISLNSGMDVALAGTTDRWFGSTSSLGGLSTLTASVTGRSGREIREDPPITPEVRGRALRKGKEKEKP